MKYKKLILLSLCMLFAGGKLIVNFPKGYEIPNNSETVELGNGEHAHVIENQIMVHHVRQIPGLKGFMADNELMKEFGKHSLHIMVLLWQEMSSRTQK
jgi:hypothetical protein